MPRNELLRGDQLTPAERKLRELHTILYPERYAPRETLVRQGLPLDDGFYQWSPDTAEAIAEALDAFATHRPGLLQLDHTPLP